MPKRSRHAVGGSGDTPGASTDGRRAPDLATIFLGDTRIYVDASFRRLLLIVRTSRLKATTIATPSRRSASRKGRGGVNRAHCPRQWATDQKQ